MKNRDFPLSPTPTQDSTAFYKKEVKKATKNLADSYSSKKGNTYSTTSVASNKLAAASKNLERQKLKGKPGYDAMGFPRKKP